MQDPIELNAEAAFECEDIIIQARQSAMNVPSRVNKHYRPPPFGSYIADAIDAHSTQLLIVLNGRLDNSNNDGIKIVLFTRLDATSFSASENALARTRHERTYRTRPETASAARVFKRRAEVGLALARRLHADARGLVARGIDPSSERRQQHAASSRTFEAVARSWLKILQNRVSKGTLTQATVDKNQRLLERHIFTVLGARPIGAISPHDLPNGLGPRKTAKEVLPPETRQI